MTDEKRILAMRNFIRGRATLEDMKILEEIEKRRPEHYGGEEVLQKSDVQGTRMQLDYRGETRDYFYTSDGIWISGRGIDVQKVYRVFGEDDKTLNVRQVQESREIEAIVQGCKRKIKEIVDKG